MPASSQPLTLCQWCNKVARRGAATPDGAWVSRQEWEARHGRIAGMPCHGICPSCVTTVLKHGRTPRLATGAKSDGFRFNREMLLEKLIGRRAANPWAIAGRFSQGYSLACLPPPDVCHHCGNDTDSDRLRGILGLQPMSFGGG